MKTVLITGATSGIGEAAARRFAAEGWRMILTGRRKDRLQAIASASKNPVLTLELDVRDRQAVEQAIAGLAAEFAEIDLLVNNAGLCLGLEPADRADVDEWEVMVDTNIKGLMYMTHAVLQGMVQRDRGHIVNIGSVAGKYAYPGGNCYGSTKAFVEQFSLNLRADLLGKQIRVTNLLPGMTETEFSVVRFRGDQRKADAVYQGLQPMTGEDIAEAIFWVASLPAHVNINQLELMPVMQAFGPFAVARKSA